jgi:hypothetical protein
MGDFLLMVVPSDIVANGKKLKLAGVSDLPSLLAQASASLGLVGDVDMSVANASPESDAAPVPVTSLDEVPAKCKVQFWPKGMYGAAVQPLAVQLLTTLRWQVVQTQTDQQLVWIYLRQH